MSDDRRQEGKLQGGGYGGAQGAGGAGRDREPMGGEIQGGSYGRSWGGPAGASGAGDTEEGIREARERTAHGDADQRDRSADDEARRRLAEPPQVVDEDGRAATIDDEGRSPDRGDFGATDES